MWTDHPLQSEADIRKDMTRDGRVGSKATAVDRDNASTGMHGLALSAVGTRPGFLLLEGPAAVGALQRLKVAA